VVTSLHIRLPPPAPELDEEELLDEELLLEELLLADVLDVLLVLAELVPPLPSSSDFFFSSSAQATNKPTVKPTTPTKRAFCFMEPPRCCDSAPSG
jgi:hypothetical protein